MGLRGIRGATTARANTADAIRDATRELLEAVVHANDLKPEDVASVYFTVTADLNAAFPASAARSMGWNHVALLDALAPPVPEDLPRCIRILVHWNTDKPAAHIRHVYLHAAAQLRPDLRAEGG